MTKLRCERWKGGPKRWRDWVRMDIMASSVAIGASERDVSGMELRAAGVSRGGGPVVGGRCSGGSRWWERHAVTTSTMGNIRGYGDEGVRRCGKLKLDLGDASVG